MAQVCFYLHAHQPRRLRPFSFFDIGRELPYFDDEANHAYLSRVVEKSYKPTNRLLLELINRSGGRFRVSFSITGVLLEQLRQGFPEVIEDFKKLSRTGSVEFITETYWHSLSSLYSSEEFAFQVKAQTRLFQELFGVKPRVLRNTELTYSDGIAQLVAIQGYQAMLIEGTEKILKERSPNHLYQSVKGELLLLPKNYRLSDDIAFRFSESSWREWPLTAEKFLHWVSGAGGDLVNLFLDYETFGEHQWPETGIFDFLKRFVELWLDVSGNRFVTPGQIIEEIKPVGRLGSPQVVTWADTERDLSAWLGNSLQRSVIKELYDLEPLVKQAADEKIIDDWRHLQISDHFYYMCTKWFADGDVHKYFNPYNSPYDAYLAYKNALQDLKLRMGAL